MEALLRRLSTSAPTQVLADIDQDMIMMLFDDGYDCYNVMIMMLFYVKCDNNKMSPVAACDHQVKMMPLGLDNLVLIDDEVNIVCYLYFLFLINVEGTFKPFSAS